MARIALNARLLIADKLEGIGWFTHECYSRMIAAHPEHEFLLLFDREPARMFEYGEHAACVRVWPPARRPWLYDWWFDWSVTRSLRTWKADVFVSTDGMLSRRTSVKQLAVMHDLNFMHHPEWMPTAEGNHYRTRFPVFAQIAARIATVSEYSKDDIMKQFGMNGDAIDLVYNAPSPLYVPLTEDQKEGQRRQWSEGNPYFIFVGSLHPRKNIGGLLEAFKMYRLGGGQADLLVVGSSMWTEEMKSLEGVHWAGRVDRPSLAGAMGGALGLVYLPLFEGFGVPLVEAFACHVPVIASNVTSLPEVCGGAAAALVAPTDVDAAATAMLQLERDAGFLKESSERGAQRAKDFSWDHSAKALWQSIEKTLAS